MAKELKQEEVRKQEKKSFFYPPQDGFDAFVCEAENQEDADKAYKEFIKQ